MKRLFLLLFLPLLLCADEKPFVIVVRSHNNREVLTLNLDSLFMQRYQNYRIIYISDGSSDGSDVLIDRYIRNNQREEQVLHIKNSSEKGGVACSCQAIFSCERDEIVLELNGCDRLAHDEVLSRLNEVYADSAIWMTDGSIPSFYAALFQSIRKEDFLYEGKFIPSAHALPYLTSLREMAIGHIKSISDPVCISSSNSSSSVENTVDESKRAMPLYSPLSELSFANLDSHSPQAEIYRQIENIYRPTSDNYRLINNYLLYGYRPNMDRLDEVYGYRQATIRLIGDSPQQIPTSGLVHVNCDGEEKGNCIILYCTFNRNLPRGLMRLLEAIKSSNFQGDVLYRLGGWPDEQGGSLLLSHVPYAFKPCFFKEAQRLGYQRILWLDASIVPVANLNEIFGMIREKGFFVMGNIPTIGPFMTSQAAVYFGLSLEETQQIPSCSSGIFGIDLTQKKGRDLLEHWYRAAQDPDAFYTPRADQNVLSILLHQFNISDFIPIRRMPHAEIGEQIQPDSLFYLDRMFTKE